MFAIIYLLATFIADLFKPPRRPLGSFATWQAERAVGDHDRSTLRLRLDPQRDVAKFEPGMTVWLAR
jgi:hypothetical protein